MCLAVIYSRNINRLNVLFHYERLLLAVVQMVKKSARTITLSSSIGLVLLVVLNKALSDKEKFT